MVFFKHVLCLGNPQILDFVLTVLDEISEFFPSKKIHIGGDEVLKTKWLSCPRCRSSAEEQGINTAKELQQQFMNRIVKCHRLGGFARGLLKLFWVHLQFYKRDLRIIIPPEGLSFEISAIRTDLSGFRQLSGYLFMQ